MNYLLMHVGVQLKELTLHSHNPLHCIRSALEWLRKFYQLSLLGQERRKRGLKGKTGHSWDLIRGEDASAPASRCIKYTPCQAHAVALRNSRNRVQGLQSLAPSCFSGHCMGSLS